MVFSRLYHLHTVPTSCLLLFSMYSTHCPKKNTKSQGNFPRKGNIFGHHFNYIPPKSASGKSNDPFSWNQQHILTIELSWILSQAREQLILFLHCHWCCVVFQRILFFCCALMCLTDQSRSHKMPASLFSTLSPVVVVVVQISYLLC